MKIAVTSTGDRTDCAIDPRFGRTDWFMVHDSDSNEWSAHSNENDAVHGAGVKTGQFIAGLGAKAVITGHIGPNAINLLKKAGIQTFLTPDCTVQEAFDAYQAGKLQEATQPDSPAHSGM